jgi:hypothetical protein
MIKIDELRLKSNISVNTVQMSTKHIRSFKLIKLFKLFNLALKKTELHGLSPRANYTDRETAACRRGDCQLLRIEGATWSA